MRELSLFSGIGGGLLGTKLLGWRSVGYVEWNEYCQRVLRQRIEDGWLDEAPIFGDLRAFIADGYARAYQGLVDVITAGFPCQPFSVAGKQRGAEDERNMWPQTIECIRLVRPRYVLLENVPGLLAGGYLGTILGELAESGFDAKWRVLSAAEVGAPHKRDRLWIVAHSTGERCGETGKYFSRSQERTDWVYQESSYADCDHEKEIGKIPRGE
jgi:DNA (cytosine-5)-methyltransferase 1